MFYTGEFAQGQDRLFCDEGTINPFLSCSLLGKNTERKTSLHGGHTQIGNLFQLLLLVPGYRGSCLFPSPSEDEDGTCTAGKTCCRSQGLPWQYDMFAIIRSLMAGQELLLRAKQMHFLETCSFTCSNKQLPQACEQENTQH